VNTRCGRGRGERTIAVVHPADTAEEITMNTVTQFDAHEPHTLEFLGAVEA
jgi:hypothetical protein